MLKISFLGGLGEFGKNFTAIESKGKILLVDCGAMFPEPDAPGVDLIIPDFTYVQEHMDDVAALVLTHGHEDHIGAVPFLLKSAALDLYATPLTLGLLSRKFEEFGVAPKSSTVLQPGVPVEIGPFNVEGIPVTHSIPDAVSLIIRTPEGTIVHSGDFKLDQTPPDGRLTHYHRFQEVGREGVTALMIDSTNVEVEGIVGSELLVRQHLEPYITGGEGKLIIALFATNLVRIQSIYELAARSGRKVALFGRSMVRNVKVAMDLGYVSPPPGVAVDLESVPDLSPEEVIVLATGSQGEPLSAMTRIAFDENKHVRLEDGDRVLFSSRIIPGNEKRVARIVNQVYKKGGEVVTVRDDKIHVSGHAAQEEIKLLASWVRPRYYIPVHGEYRQLKGNVLLARQMGYPDNRILLCETGDCLQFEGGEFRKKTEVPTGALLIDGDSTDPVDRVVVRDRRHLSKDGVVVPIVVINRQSGRLESEPEIISRGYPFLEGGNGSLEGVRRDLTAMIGGLGQDELRDLNILKAKVKSTVKKNLKKNEAKIPLIVPVVMEI
ncbi:MAG: ribonuclease J [Acidobacteriota bacterium]|jgi:ribonuclease J